MKIPFNENNNIFYKEFIFFFILQAKKRKKEKRKEKIWHRVGLNFSQRRVCSEVRPSLIWASLSYSKIIVPVSLEFPMSSVKKEPQKIVTPHY